MEAKELGGRRERRDYIIMKGKEQLIADQIEEDVGISVEIDLSDKTIRFVDTRWIRYEDLLTIADIIRDARVLVGP